MPGPVLLSPSGPKSSGFIVGKDVLIEVERKGRVWRREDIPDVFSGSFEVTLEMSVLSLPLDG